MTDVRQVEATTRALRSLDHQVEGRLARETAASQVLWAEGLLARAEDDKARRRLIRAITVLDDFGTGRWVPDETRACRSVDGHPLHRPGCRSRGRLSRRSAGRLGTGLATVALLYQIVGNYTGELSTTRHRTPPQRRCTPLGWLSGAGGHRIARLEGQALVGARRDPDELVVEGHEHLPRLLTARRGQTLSAASRAGHRGRCPSAMPRGRGRTSPTARRHRVPAGSRSRRARARCPARTAPRRGPSADVMDRRTEQHGVAVEAGGR